VRSTPSPMTSSRFPTEPVDERVRVRIGLIVNPIAGMGGSVALKGTDGDCATRAAARGAQPRAGSRARRALRNLISENLVIVAAPGEMGADLTTAEGLPTEIIGLAMESPTTAADTRAAALAIASSGVELLLFAGGDGTLRDIWETIGTTVPVLGIPSGVKMHSGAFAATPERAGEAVRSHIRRSARGARLRAAEVVDLVSNDIDRRSYGSGPRLYGEVMVPAYAPGLVGPKTITSPNEAALDALARRTARELEAGTTHLFGPGTTTMRVLRHLGLEGTLLGVDAVRDGRLVGVDLDERDLLCLVRESPAAIIAGVIGGQGFLFGRGNQQLSPAVIRAVGLDRIRVLADPAKLRALDPAVLRVDTGDPDLDADLSGYRTVAIGPRQSTVIRVTT
jgi:predicted polyphosphate/ATP-dependent NAD kinase